MNSKHICYYIPIQCLIIITLLLILNGICWITIHLRDDATFFESEKWQSWDKLPSFKNKKFAKELSLENQKIKSIYSPFNAWHQQEFSGKFIKTNKDGERNFYYTKYEKSHDTKKIVRLFGGSTMWGVGASDENTIAANIQKSNKNYLIFNHGMQGYNSRQSLERLLTLYQNGKTADIVIFYDGVNEMSMCANTISLPGHYQEDLFRLKVTNRNTTITPLDVMKQGIYSAFLKNIIEMTQRIHQKFFTKVSNVTCSSGYICKCDSVRTKKIAKMLIENWKIAKTLVESKGGKFVAILQPVFSEGSANISYLNKGNQLIDYNDNFKKLYKEIKKEITLNQYYWIHDFTDVLDGKEAFYLDYCHVNANANLNIAEKMNLILNNNL